MISCSTPPPSEPRAVSRRGDPALDDGAYLLSETDFRTILRLVRAEIARTHPWYSVRRVHVLAPNKAEVFARDPYVFGDQQNGGDNHVFYLERRNTGWTVTGDRPIMILT